MLLRLVDEVLSQRPCTLHRTCHSRAFSVLASASSIVFIPRVTHKLKALLCPCCCRLIRWSARCCSPRGLLGLSCWHPASHAQGRCGGSAVLAKTTFRLLQWPSCGTFARTSARAPPWRSLSLFTLHSFRRGSMAASPRQLGFPHGSATLAWQTLRSESGATPIRLREIAYAKPRRRRRDQSMPCGDTSPQFTRG